MTQSVEIAPTEQMQQQPESSGIMSVIEKAALAPNVDPSKLEKLLDMQERIIDKNAAQAFSVAMVRAQMNMPKIAKTADNSQTNSKYAKLENIIADIKPIYTEQGLALSFSEGDSPHDGYIRIVCDVMHELGHTKTYHHDLPLDNAGIKGTINKTAVHAKGSTISYGRRYLTLMIFNLATGDDDDGNASGNFSTISEDQINTIYSLINDNDLDMEKFKSWMSRTLKVDSIEQINTNGYDLTIRTIKQTIKNKVGA